jgi:hypothetical protein
MRSSLERFVVEVLVPLLVCCGLAVAIFHQAFLVGPMHPANLLTFVRVPEEAPGQHLPREWKPRLLSTLLGARAVDWGRERARRAQPSLFESEAARRAKSRPEAVLADSTALVLSYAAGGWVAGWLFLTGLLFVVHRRGRSLLYLFGAYAVVSFGYMPGIDVRIYSWDMPALFFYAVFVVLHDRGRPWWLLGALPVAMAFKETAIVLSVAFLLWEGLPLRRRLMLFASATLACIAVKLGIDLWTQNPALFLTMTSSQGGASRLQTNLTQLFRLGLPHPLLANAGTLLALFCLPHRRPAIAMLKVVALLFTGASFVFAYIVEYRIWFELAPIALYGLDLTYLRGDGSGVGRAGSGPPSARRPAA